MGAAGIYHIWPAGAHYADIDVRTAAVCEHVQVRPPLLVSHIGQHWLDCHYCTHVLQLVHQRTHYHLVTVK
jgi:hypothetical protein